MTLHDIQQICKSLENVTVDIKWGHDLCFSIDGKMFLVTSSGTIPVSASFKTNEEAFNELVERTGFKPAPYLAKHKWVFVDDINRLSKKEWQQFARQSYNLVLSKLPKKKQ